ncbi:hypothetical protein CAEBREN_03538 [Caenorhabditis brenneri]|uniref:Uncharacterized protein n=1 Tax=Caenorhabditis brenneri TaxID=135651 RepID=G0NQ65_CAEBE|nr:hypothetical protein CAEBREN_03538 [Caenorhabditis brenneri]
MLFSLFFFFFFCTFSEEPHDLILDGNYTSWRTKGNLTPSFFRVLLDEKKPPSAIRVNVDPVKFVLEDPITVTIIRGTTVHNIACPLFDPSGLLELSDNYFYQTFTKFAGFTLKKSEIGEKFHLALTVLPDDALCGKSSETFFQYRMLDRYENNEPSIFEGNDSEGTVIVDKVYLFDKVNMTVSHKEYQKQRLVKDSKYFVPLTSFIYSNYSVSDAIFITGKAQTAIYFFWYIIQKIRFEWSTFTRFYKVMGFAMVSVFVFFETVVYIELATTYQTFSVSMTPAKSRELNVECALPGIDYNDLLHYNCAFNSFTFIILMDFIDSNIKGVPKKNIFVF